MNVAQFSAAVEKSLKGVTRRVMLSPILPLLLKDQAWHDAFATLNELFGYHTDLALGNHNIYSNDPQNDFLDKPQSEKPFVMLRELVEKSQDRNFLRDLLVSIFLPAFQAFPIGLADVVFQVARAPRVWLKIRAEALELGDIQLTFEVLRSMEYLQYVIEESKFLITFPAVRRLLSIDRLRRPTLACPS